MKNPRGYTWQDLLLAGGLILVIGGFIVFLANPALRFGNARDDRRVEDVRDLMQIVLGLEVENPEAFAAILGPSASGRTMIGTSNDCSGSFEPLCPDDILRDKCLDLSLYTEEYVPIDLNPEFSSELTGYYIQFENNTLEIGACMPESRGEVVLRKQYLLED